MKLTTRRELLSAVTGWVTATARPGRTPGGPPVLAGLLLTASEDGSLTVAGYDYQVSALARLTCAEVGEPGQALIPARMLTQAAAILPAGYEGVTITTDPTRAVITAGQVTYTLMLLPHEEFPALPEPGEPVAEFGADHLAAAVTQAVTAAGHDGTLPALTCVHLSLDGKDTATLAATDRYRLAVVTCPYTPHGDSPPEPVLIPARDLAAVTKRADTPTITLALDGDGTAAFTTADRQVTARLTAAEFPRYTTLIPAREDIKATVTADLADLAAAVKRAAVVAEKDTPVRLGFTPDTMRIDAGTGDDAAYAEDIPACPVGDPFPAAFNPHYLLDALGAVAAAGGDTVRFALTGPAKPALITPAEPGGPVTGRHVLMPIRGTG
jgi:DNA polymerase-3 subunit beta